MKQIEIENKDRLGLVNLVYGSDQKYSGAEKTMALASLIKKLKENFPKQPGETQEEINKVMNEYALKKEKVKVKLEELEFTILKGVVDTFEVTPANAEAMSNIFKMLDDAEEVKSK